MHDIFEGVIPFELKLVLQQLADVDKFFTSDYLRKAIANFNYSSSDTNSRPPCPPIIVDMKLKAAECWCLFRNLPCLIAPTLLACW